MLIRQFIAQVTTAPAPAVRGMSPAELGSVLLSTAIFTVFGLLVFGLAYVIIIKATPFSIRKELEEDHNTAIAIVIGSVIIGIGLIVAAAIQG
jgi:putative membrane protein